MKTETFFPEPSSLNLVVQKALRPINRRFYYSSYINSLPLKPNDKVLEFGSGIGTVAALLAQRLDKGEVTCVDVSNRYLNAARKHLKQFSNANLLHGGLTSLNLNPGKFDAINVHFVLHDVSTEHRQMLVSEMFKLLRPGGKVYLREPLSFTHGIPVHEIKRLFAKAGFSPLNETIGKNRIMGEHFSATYAKISTIRFFFS